MDEAYSHLLHRIIGIGEAESLWQTMTKAQQHAFHCPDPDCYAPVMLRAVRSVAVKRHFATDSKDAVSVARELKALRALKGTVVESDFDKSLHYHSRLCEVEFAEKGTNSKGAVGSRKRSGQIELISSEPLSRVAARTGFGTSGMPNAKTKSIKDRMSIREFIDRLRAWGPSDYRSRSIVVDRKKIRAAQLFYPAQWLQLSEPRGQTSLNRPFAFGRDPAPNLSVDPHVYFGNAMLTADGAGYRVVFNEAVDALPEVAMAVSQAVISGSHYRKRFSREFDAIIAAGGRSYCFVLGTASFVRTGGRDSVLVSPLSSTTDIVLPRDQAFNPALDDMLHEGRSGFNDALRSHHQRLSSGGPEAKRNVNGPSAKAKPSSSHRPALATGRVASRMGVTRPHQSHEGLKQLDAEPERRSFLNRAVAFLKSLLSGSQS